MSNNNMENHIKWPKTSSRMPQTQRLRLHQSPQNIQQSKAIIQACLTQVLPHIQSYMNGSSCQQVDPRVRVFPFPTNQFFSSIKCFRHGTVKDNSITLFTEYLANVKFSKLPFYELHDELIKPTILAGVNNNLGLRTVTYKFTFTPEQASIIAMNHNISDRKNEYIYQVQLRFGLFNPKTASITDFLPPGLIVKINEKYSILPSFPRMTPEKPTTRRIAKPINGTNEVNLNPIFPNYITLNWMPDTTYIMGTYLVKKWSSETLVQKLYEKGARSLEETRNYIINKFKVSDTNLAIMSYRVSIVCPLSKIRMKHPAKSSSCDHLQCFDASIFILMNEQNATWICPTCNKPCLYDKILIDFYFLEIVNSPNLSDNCEEIEVFADGGWKAHVKNRETLAHTNEKPMDYINLDDSDKESPTEA